MNWPKLMIPVPNCSGSATPPPSGELAMTISAVRPVATGFRAVPTSNRPTCVISGIPWSPITIRLVTVSRVFTAGLNRRTPCTATV